MATKHCFDFVKTHISSSLLNGEDLNKEYDSSNYESLFLEAMRLGIDPGTMDSGQLSQAVKFAKGDKNQEGGDD